jgi:hypothetical protein
MAINKRLKILIKFSQMGVKKPTFCNGNGSGPGEAGSKLENLRAEDTLRAGEELVKELDVEVLEGGSARGEAAPEEAEAQPRVDVGQRHHQRRGCRS